MGITLIACITSDGGLDNKGEYVISKKEYIEWLKGAMDTNGINIIGKRTYDEGILEDVLEGKELIIYTNKSDVGDILRDNKNVRLNVLGGSRVFKDFIKYADRIVLLEVAGVVKSEKYFPEFDLKEYTVEDFNDIEGSKYYGVEKIYKRKQKLDIDKILEEDKSKIQISGINVIDISKKRITKRKRSFRYYYYELRHGDDFNKPLTIEDKEVIVNYFATVVLEDKIDFEGDKVKKLNLDEITLIINYLKNNLDT